jgi:hypothetical protein
LQQALLANPETGPVIPQTGGFRKMRWPDWRRRKGTRGGLRIIYYYFVDDAQIWLVTLYGKDELEDLTPDQKRTLKYAIDTERQARSARHSRALKKAR